MTTLADRAKLKQIDSPVGRTVDGSARFALVPIPVRFDHRTT